MMTLSIDTPETQEAIERWRQGKINIFDEMARLERERDEAQGTLTDIHRWIERNHPDGFIDSMTFHQNLERVVDRWYDRLDIVERERDEAREESAKLRDISDGCLIALERATKYLPEYSRVNYEDALWRLRKKLEEETK
jgi:hypothetical protein